MRDGEGGAPRQLPRTSEQIKTATPNRVWAGASASGRIWRARARRFRFPFPLNGSLLGSSTRLSRFPGLSESAAPARPSLPAPAAGPPRALWTDPDSTQSLGHSGDRGESQARARPPRANDKLRVPRSVRVPLPLPSFPRVAEVNAAASRRLGAAPAGAARNNIPAGARRAAVAQGLGSRPEPLGSAVAGGPWGPQGNN